MEHKDGQSGLSPRYIIVLVAACIMTMALSVTASVLICYQLYKQNTPDFPSINYTPDDEIIVALAQALTPNTVEISKGDSYGTGVIVSHDDGYPLIITNCHITGTSGSEAIAIRYYNESNYYSKSVEILGYSTHYDICILKALKKPKHQFLDIVSDGKLDAGYNIRTGQKVLAVGNALANGITVSDGLIGNPDRVVNKEDESKILPMLQITAAINAGMSGGPLFSLDGYLIGINTFQSLKTGADRPVDGIGYSVPVSVFAPLYAQAVSSAHQKGNSLSLIDIRYSISYEKVITLNALDVGVSLTFEDGSLRVKTVDTGVLGNQFAEGDKILKIGGYVVEPYKYCSVTGAFLRYSKSGSGQSLIVTVERNGTATDLVLSGFTLVAG